MAVPKKQNATEDDLFNLDDESHTTERKSVEVLNILARVEVSLRGTHGMVGYVG